MNLRIHLELTFDARLKKNLKILKLHIMKPQKYVEKLTKTMHLSGVP